MTAAANERRLRDIEKKILKFKSREKASSATFAKAEQRWWKWQRDNPEPSRSDKVAHARWRLGRRGALKKFRPADRDWREVSCGAIALCKKAAQIEATTLIGLTCKARIAKLDSNLLLLGESIVRDILALRIIVMAWPESQRRAAS